MRTPLRRLILGRPIPTWLALHQRLPKVLALPVFASDAMSSVAYATEEIVIALVAAGSMALGYLMPITFAIVILLAIVATSYRQTIYAYPSGGGSYIVARENLGVLPGLIAAAALLTDYVLTVSVSISSGVANFIAAVPSLESYRVLICFGLITVMMFANLRGLKESGMLFALPSYAFVVSLFTLIVVGAFKLVTHRLAVTPPPHIAATTPLTAFLLLRAFAGGCSAMTGTEAISNGIPAFRPPESRNAAITLVWMAVILGTLFLGVSGLAHLFGVVPRPPGTVVSEVAERVFTRDWFYYFIQTATLLILVVAAQTSFADFPRLSAILARDRFMPRQLANIGDRLAFSNGIIALWAVSSALVVIFRADVTSLIPLYAIGVFLSFTLSQAGMVVHTRRNKEKNWRVSAAISGIGAVTTAVVAIVAAVAKFAHGAYIVVFLIPLLVLLFLIMNRHYRKLAEQLRLPPGEPAPLPEMRHTVLVLVPGIHKGILPALQYAKSLSPDCRAVYIETDPADTPLIEERWEKWGQGIPLVVLESPYRSVIQPLLKYLDEVKEERARHIVTVIIPEFVPPRRWNALLHNQTGLTLKLALLGKKDIVVTNIRYYLEK